MRCRTTITLLCGLTLGFSRTAQACETASKATPDSVCVVMLFGERAGVWFDRDAAEKLRLAIATIPIESARADAAEALAKLETQRADAYRKAFELVEQAAKLQQQRAEKAEKAGADAATALALEKSKPSLWWIPAGVGVIGGWLAGREVGKLVK